MPFSIYAIDQEFAASTGANVNTSPDRSVFDNPPNASKDLVITTLAGDSDPRHFELGDTYDLSWGGFGGGGSITNAVVIRSDEVVGSPGSGVIVFEGVDDNGDPAQIVWTPGFDLEQWYSDNYNPSAEPEFWTGDQQPAYSHTYICFAAPTRIETPEGPRRCDWIREGDLVMTEGAGPQPVRWVGRKRVAGMGEAAPVEFAAGEIGNFAPVRLSPDHRVLIRGAALDLHFGMPEALVPAKALVNGETIRRVPCASLIYVHLLLDTHHILPAEGAGCESLFLGEMAISALERARDPTCAQTGISHSCTARPTLRMADARFLTALRGSVRPSVPALASLPGLAGGGQGRA